MSDKKKFIDFMFGSLFIVVTGLIIFIRLSSNIATAVKKELVEVTPESTISRTVEISPSASPSPRIKPLSFVEMNQRYGPCTNLPVLIYHHIQNKQEALKKGQGGLTVDTETFRKHIDYLRSRNYNYVTPKDLIDFFDSEVNLPENPVMITFDDGYMDNYSEAYPIMKELGARGVVFIPTGLINNPDYLTWENISEMQGSLVFEFGNHTWSHMNVGAKKEIVEKEIVTADRQLKERGLNEGSIFAYPYGLENGFSHSILSEQRYKLAFTTRSGRIMCRGQRLSLPRVRVGDSELSFYGL